MATSVKTMSLPCASSLSLLDAVAVAAAEQIDHSTAAASAIAAASSSAVAAVGMPADSISAATTYTTPKRQAGLTAVTPSTLHGTPDGLLDEDDEGELAAQTSEREGETIVSASSTEETAGESIASPQKAAPAAPSTFSVSAAPVAAFTPGIMASAQKISKATPSIQLGPRVTPAARKNPPNTAVKGKGSSSCSHSSPVKPRNLDGALKTGESLQEDASQSLSASAAASAAHAGAPIKEEECPSTPADQLQRSHIPAPSSFFAANISPLRSSTRKNGDKNNGVSAAVAAAAMLGRVKTPPPADSSDMDPAKLTPGMFLSPRTPNPAVYYERIGTKTSGMTPGLTPGLTPTNFASDFGRGYKKEGGLNDVDASNVFAWLNSPGGQGLFSPSGALNSLSVTNTPRGMYGFIGPAGSIGKEKYGPPRLGPSLLTSSNHHHEFFAGLEAGGDVGVNTPKIPDQRSMINISPLASRKSVKNRGSAVVGESIPDTPGPIDFTTLFASPRLPTPRLSQKSTGMKMEDGMTSDALPSPVISALHTAERDINLDDDLNALLQLAETTTPGGRPLAFLSPLLTNSLRRATTAEYERSVLEPPSSLQLPMISGSSIGSSPQKLTRKGSPSGRANISPPQLAIRSSSSGVLDGSISPTKSSLKKKSKKRRIPDVAGSSSGDYQGLEQQQGYSHPSMIHYGGHSHTTAPLAHHGYYNHPGYHAGSHHGYVYPGHTNHPAPQQHYAYADQQQPSSASAVAAATTSASPIKLASVAKTPRKKNSGRSRVRPKKSAASKTTSKSPVTTKSESRPATPSTTKRVRKSTAKAGSGGGSALKKSKNAVHDPADKERISAAIFAVNTVYGDGSEKEKKLAAATLRGVTQRPSKKWQAQLYYAGKSRYIGVFDSKEKASLAYEIAREVLKNDKGEDAHAPVNAEETDRNVCLARKAAHAGVNEHSGK